jgi:hypothetical protein
MQSDNVYHLLYRSFKSDYFDENEVGKIVASSLLNNTHLGITGILMYRDGIFIQLLEGDEDDLLKLYEEHICKDKRHHDCKVLVSKDNQTRIFNGWNMGVVSKNLLHSEFPSFFELIEQKLEKIDDDELYEDQLISFLRKFNKSNPDLSVSPQRP